MPPFSSRLLVMFLLTVVFLSFTNYIFINFYNLPIRRKPIYQKYVNASRVEFKPLALNSKSWANLLLCEESAETAAVNGTSNDCGTKRNTIPMTYSIDAQDTGSTDTLCPMLPPGLGPMLEDRSTSSLNSFASLYNQIKPGGKYNTTTCKARHRVAIITAFRGPKTYLATFLYTLHVFLMKQQLDYQIFVVEPSNTTQPFNRGKLLNVGFTEARRHRGDWDCFVFHEANIVPTDSRNLYRCSWYPRQLALIVNRPNNKSSYLIMFGGAVSMTAEQFFTINGFSNLYWGNDADYNDLYKRLIVANYLIEQTIRTVGKYRTLKNGYIQTRLKTKMKETLSPLYLLDGLTTLSYSLTHLELRPLYTHIQVNIDDIDEKSLDITTAITNLDTYKDRNIQRNNVNYTE